MTSKTCIGISFLVVLTSCSDVTTFDLSDGYFYKFVGGNSLTHQNGNSQLWRKIDGHDQLIWPFIIGKEVVTNGIAIFNGGLTDDSRQWKSKPALLVCDSSSSVFEITESLNQVYCRRRNFDYTILRGRCVYEWPAYTNGVFSIAGRVNTPTNLNWIEVTFNQTELTELVAQLKREGVKQQYRGASYVIAR